MSTLLNLTNYGTDYQIGEVVNILAGDSNSNSNELLESGGFIRCGKIYNQSDYPKLYAKLKNINGKIFSTIIPPDLSYGTKTWLLYVNNSYIFFGSSGIYVTTTDFSTWTQRTTNTSVTLNDIIYANGIFVAVGNSATLLTSVDGINWTGIDTGISSVNSIYKVLYDGTRFVILAGAGIVAVSNDAASWVQVTSNSTIGIPNYFRYLNGVYFAGKTTALVYSTDLLTWTNQQFAGSGVSSDIIFAENRYVTISSNYNSIIRSIGASLTAWQGSGITPDNPLIYNISYNSRSNIYIALTGSGIYTSDDLYTWSFLQNSNYYVFSSDSAATYINNIMYVVQPSIILKSTNILAYGETEAYDSTTQFYVPEATLTDTSLTASGWSANYTTAVWKSYIKAK